MFTEQLAEKGSSYSFFQLVYLLERYLCPADSKIDSTVIDDKIIKLIPSLSMGFPSSDVVKVEKITQGDKASFVVETSFLGLYGSYSPLPAFYTEDILWDENKQIYLKGILDLFHHRLLSLFYKSWSKYRYYIQFKTSGKDNFSKMMLALAGLNLTSFDSEKTGLSAISLLKFSGLATQRPTSSSSTSNILNSFFSEAAIKIKELVAKWLIIPLEQKNSLGRRNCQLGENLHLGRKFLDRTSNFRVMVQPNTFQVFLKFLPGERYFIQLVALTRLFAPSNLKFDIELKFPYETIERIPLDYTRRMRLGYTSWLGDVKAGKSIVFASCQ